MGAVALRITQDRKHVLQRIEAAMLARADALREVGRLAPTDPLEQLALELSQATESAPVRAPVQQRLRIVPQADPVWNVVPQASGSIELLKNGKHLRWIASHLAEPHVVARELLVSAFSAKAAAMAWDFGQEHELELTQHGGGWTRSELEDWARRYGIDPVDPIEA